jgi:hypothetical protein
MLAFMGAFYNFLIGSFEILALGVLLACVLFFCRRNFKKLKGSGVQKCPGHAAMQILF